DDQDFVALAPEPPSSSEPEEPMITRRVSGAVTLNSVGLAGVTVSAWPTGGSAVTDSRGQYTLRIPYLSKGWNGQISASHPDYTFDPPFREYTNFKDHVKNQNFVALPKPIGAGQ